MEFEIVDLSSVSEDELIKVLGNNIRTSHLMMSEIEKLKKYSTAVSVSEESVSDNNILTNDHVADDSELDDDFEDEVDYYYQLLKSYNALELEKNISKILPSRHNYNYERILYRMKAEVLKNIKEIKDFICSENLSLEDAEMFRDDLQLESKRLELLDKYLSPEIENGDVQVENKLVFFPTANGNIHVFDCLDGIDVGYLERFNELFTSIKNGTFKGVKRFNNHTVLNGLCEVRGPLVRVVYARLSSDVYVIISAFVKKSLNDQGYKNFLVKHCRDYKNIERLLRENIENEDFMKLSSEYEQELFRILNDPNAKASTLVKEKGGTLYGKYFGVN